MGDLEYWKECVSFGAEDAGVTLSDEQLTAIATTVSGGHECYGMAFYSPPDSDRYAQIERESDAKLKALQREFDKYRDNAETAVKKALHQHSDAMVSIGEYGKVLRYGGRTEQIQ